MTQKQLAKFNQKIEIEDIKPIINNLNLRKASGIDDISPFMIKFGKAPMRKLLVWMFNKVVETGKVPKEWKKGIIIPIPKTKSKLVGIDEFRPICLLSVIGIIFEKVICSRLEIISKELCLIPSFQSGFVKGKSTTDNQIKLQQTIHNTFVKKDFMVAVFLDIKKAYDCVDRSLLIKDLMEIGLEGQMAKCLFDILSSDRSARVIYDGEVSSNLRFKNGVPQGSPLSPLLFNIYLKNLKTISGENILQFADDIVIWKQGSNLYDIISSPNNRLKIISEWFAGRKLKLSPKKCVPVIFSRKRKIDPPKLYIDNNCVEYKESAKYLGLHWDKTLNWSIHTKEIQNKCAKKLGMLKFIQGKYKLRQELCITLYKTMIRPVIEFGSEIWSDTSKINWSRINSIEHRSLTKALGTMICAKRSEVNIEAGVIPIKLRIQERIIKKYDRLRKTELGDYVGRFMIPGIKIGLRKSFSQKVMKLRRKYNITVHKLKELNTKELKLKIYNEWIRKCKKQRKNYKVYNSDKWKTQYTGFTRSRKIQAIWHQAKLMVLPTNQILHMMDNKKSDKCIFDNEIDTNQHFIQDCEGYIHIWKKIFPKNEIRKNDLKVLLDEDRPPPIKRKISVAIIQSLKYKKVRSYTSDM